MFFRIGDERFKMSDVKRYRKDGKSVSNGKYYMTVWFGRYERKFCFDTEKELTDVLDYLDSVFKVTVI